MTNFLARRDKTGWVPVFGSLPAAPTNKLPTAAFTATVQDLAVTVDGSGSTDSDGTIKAYQWDFGDKSLPASGARVVHTYSDAGSFIVTLTVTDDKGGTATRMRTVTVARPATTSAWDWSDGNTPWDIGGDLTRLTASWPSNLVIVDLVEGGTGDFNTDLNATVNAQGGKKVVVRLKAKTYHVKKFTAPTATAPDYALGFFAFNCIGLLGVGADQTVIQLDANIYTDAQLYGAGDKTGSGVGNNRGIVNMTTATGPIQYHFGRIGDGSNPAYVAGITFRGSDQQTINAYSSTLGIKAQPAPYQGVSMYQTKGGLVSFSRFQASSHGAFSQPPFETGSITTQYGSLTYRNCEFDGRLAAEVSTDRTRRGGPIMNNNETLAEFTDCWMHHSNVSRYAANDQNRDTQGTYTFTRCKSEEISNIDNYGLGGVTNASNFGFESSNANITFTDCIIVQNNSRTSGQIACHLQLTHVGGRNPSGGTMKVIRGEYRNAGFPSIDGYLSMRITTSAWLATGYPAIDVRNAAGVRKTPITYTGAYPSADLLQQAGATPDTHFLVRNS